MKRSIISLVNLLLLFSFPGISFAGTEHITKAKGFKAIPVEIGVKIPLPSCYHEGLFFDGKNIWVANGRNGPIWVVEPSSGKIVSEMAPIAGFTEAITVDSEGNYFVTDWLERKLYRARPEDGKLVARSALDLAPGYPAGVIWNGRTLFVVTWTRGTFGTKFHLLELSKDGVMLRKMSINKIQEPAHLAWDGTYLWITSWYSKKVYKVDINNWKMTGYFKSPVSKATGIVWDGQYLWLTGTYGDLYQIKVKK